MKKLLLTLAVIFDFSATYGQTHASGDIKAEKTKVLYVGFSPVYDSFPITTDQIETKLRIAQITDRILYTNFSNRIKIVTKGQHVEVDIVGAAGSGWDNGKHIKPYEIHHCSITPYPNKPVRLFMYEITSDNKRNLIDSCVFETKEYPIEVFINGKRPGTTIDANELLYADSSAFLITCNAPSLKIRSFDLNWQINGADGGFTSYSNHLTDEMKAFLAKKSGIKVYLELIEFEFPNGVIRAWRQAFLIVR